MFIPERILASANDLTDSVMLEKECPLYYCRL